MILVTGGLGMIGAHTARALVDSDRRSSSPPTGGPRSRRPRRQGHSGIPRRHRSGRPSCPRRSLRHQRHRALAGTIPGDDPVSYFRTDTTGLFNALDAACSWGVRRFAVASSIGVYPGRTEIPWHEEFDLPSAGLTPTYVNAGNHSDGWLTTSDEIADHYARTATSPLRR